MNNPFLHLDPLANDGSFSDEHISGEYFSESYQEACKKFAFASEKLGKQRLCVHDTIKICPDRFYPDKREEDCNMQITIVSLDERDANVKANCMAGKIDERDAHDVKANSGKIANESGKIANESGKIANDVKANSDTKLITVVSGVHGVEGYAGSAIQLMLLEKLLLRKSESPDSAGVPRHGGKEFNSAGVGEFNSAGVPEGDRIASTNSAGFLPNTLLVLVHAVNPFGMKYFRRWNENNVDLNRNALSPSDFALLLKRDKLQRVYDKFDGLFNPKTAPSWFFQKVGFFVSALKAVLTHGVSDIKTALVAATYKTEKGIFFGGKELQKSHIELRKYFREKFGSTIQSRNVVWVDIHTGLGPCGLDVILTAPEDATALGDWFPKVEGKCEGVQVTEGKGSSPKPNGIDVKVNPVLGSNSATNTTSTATPNTTSIANTSSAANSKTQLPTNNSSSTAHCHNSTAVTGPNVKSTTLTLSSNTLAPPFSPSRDVSRDMSAASAVSGPVQKRCRSESSVEGTSYPVLNSPRKTSPITKNPNDIAGFSLTPPASPKSAMQKTPVSPVTAASTKSPTADSTADSAITMKFPLNSSPSFSPKTMDATTKFTGKVVKQPLCQNLLASESPKKQQLALSPKKQPTASLSSPGISSLQPGVSSDLSRESSSIDLTDSKTEATDALIGILGTDATFMEEYLLNLSTEGGGPRTYPPDFNYSEGGAAAPIGCYPEDDDDDLAAPIDSNWLLDGRERAAGIELRRERGAQKGERILSASSVATVDSSESFDSAGIKPGGSDSCQPNSDSCQPNSSASKANNSSASKANSFSSKEATTTSSSALGNTNTGSNTALGNTNTGSNTTESGPNTSNTTNSFTSRFLAFLVRFFGLESKSQASGYEFTCGYLSRQDWLSGFFKPSSGRVLAFTQEFGTLPNLMVARALCLENAGFHHDTLERHRDYWAPTYTKPAFYCSDNVWWKRRVLDGGKNVVGKLWEQCVLTYNAQHSSTRRALSTDEVTERDRKPQLAKKI